MKAAAKGSSWRPERNGWLWAALLLCGGMQTDARAQLTVNVVTPGGTPVNGFRWLLEEDNTLQPIPGELVSDSLAVNIHNSHAPVVASGHSGTDSAVINVSADKRYFVSVLPDSGHTLSGRSIAVGATQATVIVNTLPIPTAQFSVLVFRDTSPINNEPELPAEEGLEGFTVVIDDTAGHQITDAYGNPLGTEYALGLCSVNVSVPCLIGENCPGFPALETCVFTDPPPLDVDGSPFIAEDALGNPLIGDSSIQTNVAGEALIKYLAPGKYGVKIIPPAMPPGQEWVQTSTMEGTPTIDAFVKAGEPTVFVEFGPAAWHVFVGFVQAFNTLDTVPGVSTGTITGRLVYNHFSRPPTTQGFFPGTPVEDCWVGLNHLTSRVGHYAAACNADSTFTISGVKQATYWMVTWDKHLDSIFGFQVVTMPDPVQGWNIDLGDVLAFSWFGGLEGTVFYDTLENGFWDGGYAGDEWGIPMVELLLRFRDGTIYQATMTDLLGRYWFTEIFPFFHWLIVEVAFGPNAFSNTSATLRDTGFTNVVDNGGEIPADAGWAMPSRGKLNPQPQFSAPGACSVSGKPCHLDDHCDVMIAETCVGAVPLINPNTGNNLSRTETGYAPGAFLLQGMTNFLSQINVIDWGKIAYEEGRSGGIAGVTFYSVTRAEDDPAYAAGEGWEPGIPRVQVNLYEDVNPYDGVIDDLDGDGGPTLADVDNHPLGWFEGGARGPEDVDRDDPVFDVGVDETAVFYPGDAIQIVHSDSFDDNKPTGCIQNLPMPHGTPVPECYDNFGTWNQLRDAVWDGGWAIESHFPGGIASGSAEVDDLPAGVYIVESPPPPSYEILKEEDKNVDFGESYYPEGTVAALPPSCVGDLHEVPQFLTLFGDIDGDGVCDPGENCVYAPFTGVCVSGLCEGGSTPGAVCGDAACPGGGVCVSGFCVGGDTPGAVCGDAACPGQMRPLCDRKQVIHTAGQNTGVDFFFLTQVPKAARAVGFVNSDLGAEFDTTSPVYGEKQAPAWIPISFHDYLGNEIARTYCDEWGAFNVMLPAGFSAHIPAPTGISQNMISFVVNHPGPIPDPANPGQFITDPFFDPSFSQTPYTFHFESGRTTYLDTPVIPVAAFATLRSRTVDIDPPDGTPVLYSVMRTLGAPGGPVVCANGESVTITSMGLTAVPNPNHLRNGICVGGPGGTCDGGVNDGGACNDDNDCLGNSLTVARDYGFGALQGTVEVGGVPLDITSWTDSTINAVVDTTAVSTARLVVTRGDNGRATPLGVTFHVVANCGFEVIYVSGGATYPNIPIQDAIDAALAGTLVVVGPGTYLENPIVYKNVRIQGSGAGGTWINGNPVPFQRIGDWHAKIDALVASGDLVALDQDANLRFFEAAEAPSIFWQGKPGMFTPASHGLIDGLTVTGGISGGGIYVTSNADYLQISHNKIFNNQGTFGGGITVGQAGKDSPNESVDIHHNNIAKNGGINGAGGVTLFSGANNYTLADNLIIANFTRMNGAGVGHMGLSDGGSIVRNRILFNECFYGEALFLGGEGGGIYITDIELAFGVFGGEMEPPPVGLGPGAGSVSIVSNLIQGNLAGAGSGGGIGVDGMNGEDLNEASSLWYSLNIFNNLIVDNVAALRGGGISLLDAARANIMHNTIANNDSSATAASAFNPGNLQQSLPQGGGITAIQHSPDVAAASGQAFSDPVLVNNILWHNHSHYWDGTINGGMGGLLPGTPPHWDIQVVGGGDMSPVGCIITDTTGYDPSNFVADPSFVSEYSNTIEATGLIDEGGNFVSVRYGEVGVGSSDYRLQCTSPAINAGSTSIPAAPELDTDVDGEVRPRPINAGWDVGADEVVSLYDVDNSGDVGPGDWAFLVPCWLLCDTDAAWATSNCDQFDFDCTGCVDPGDFAFFVNAWLKPCDDASVVVPACHVPVDLPLPQAGEETLKPATRDVVESFGLPYPDGSNPRFRLIPDVANTRPRGSKLMGQRSPRG